MTSDTVAFRRIDGAEFKRAEELFRTHLAPGLPAVIRLDGRAFHTYCRGLARPFDERFMADMDATMVALAGEIDGVQLAYVQSDEISLLLQPNAAGGFMFDGQVQKLVSIAAALAASTFNARRLGAVTDQMALFDARAFSLAGPHVVQRYFEWRQADAQVNSLGMLASAHFSHRQLMGVSTGRRAAMLREAGVDPAALSESVVHGRIVRRRPTKRQTTFFDRRVGKERTVNFVRLEPCVAPAPRFADGLDAALY